MIKLKKYRTAFIFLILTVISFLLIGNSYARKKKFAAAVPSAILMEPNTGKILYAKNPNKRLIPASLVKIMTLILTFDYIKEKKLDIQTKIRITRKASRIGGRQIYLKEGEYLTLEELIKSVAIFSANDSAYQLAQVIAGSHDNFVKDMNAKAKELELKNTHFYNAHGLPKKNAASKQYTCAFDMAQLARYVFLFYPEIFKYTNIKMDSVRNGAFQLMSTNKLLWKRKDVYGLKTGYIRASGFSVVTMAKRDNFNLIAVVMGAATKNARFMISSNLLDYGFDNFKYITISDLPGLAEIPVKGGLEDEVGLKISGSESFVIPKEKEADIKIGYSLPEYLTAPVAEGQKIGAAVVSIGDKKEFSIILETRNSVAEKISFWKKIKNYFR
ncbi:D-alanyl-D-alanine carboxypeptidase [bacterium]|nr:D-alanyl-D-alanine carboxypeptidase [bacterium]